MRKVVPSMHATDQVNVIIGRLLSGLQETLSTQVQETILFGSYARNEAAEDSDIDVLVLVDLTREKIAEYTWKIGAITSELLLDYGVLVSPIVENSDFYASHTDVLPFFRNIRREGVTINA